MSFFTELKRRNVFRVGIAYSIAAWVLLQITDVVGQILELPPWGGKLILMILAVGFPLSLIFAWAFEMTPEGVKRERDVDRSQSIAPKTGKKLDRIIIALMAVAIAYLLFDKFAGQPATQGVTNPVATQGGVEAEAPEETAAERRSIAVLPFTNRSRHADDAFFVDGIHDDLLTNLARIGDLKVISRTSVLRYRDTETPIPDIAAELGVATVMEGAVQRAGDQVRVNVQLIDANTDEHLWAETYDRQLTADNLFSIQSEISGRIATALKATLSPDEQERISDRPTADLAAYNAYLRGRQALALNNSEGSGRALESFRKAVEIDPSFALAWAALAHAADQKFRYSDMKLDEILPLLEEAVGQALALDDQVGESYLAQDLLLRYRDGRWSEEREASLLQAMELSPGLAEAWLRYSDYLQQFDDRLPESLYAVERAAELDPLSKSIRNQQVSVLTSMGRLNEAESQLTRLIEMDPDFALNYRTMASIQGSKGQVAEALMWQRRAQEKDPGNILYQMREVWFLTSMGMEEEYEGLIARISRLDPNGSTELFAQTIINMRQGRLDAALETANAYADALAPSSYTGVGFRGFVHARRNEPAAALADLKLSLESRNGGTKLDEEGWIKLARTATGYACHYAWVVGNALDSDLGQRMAAAMLDRVNELAPYQQVEFSLDRAMCHQLRGETDAALTAIRIAIQERQLIGWWNALYQPAFDSLLLNPEFQKSLVEIKQIMNEELERYRQLSEDTAP